jgi:hypothetical protein
MADAGDLEKLPPEIRKEIWTHLLAEPETIQIKRLLRGKRRRKHGTVALQSSTGRSSGALRVNKLISEEATQALYGYNKFEFQNTGALLQFLKQIGDSKRHLRHAAIYHEGLIFMNSWNSLKHSIQILASVRALRTLEVSHSAFCGNGTVMLQTKELVEHCKPLLHALHDHFVTNRLNTSVLDVIRVGIPPSNCELNGTCSELGKQHLRISFLREYNSRTHKLAIPLGQCRCHCREARQVNDELEQGVRQEVAEQLELGLPIC